MCLVVGFYNRAEEENSQLVMCQAQFFCRIIRCSKHLQSNLFNYFCVPCVVCLELGAGRSPKRSNVRAHVLLVGLRFATFTQNIQLYKLMWSY